MIVWISDIEEFLPLEAIDPETGADCLLSLLDDLDGFKYGGFSYMKNGYLETDLDTYTHYEQYLTEHGYR